MNSLTCKCGHPIQYHAPGDPRGRCLCQMPGTSAICRCRKCRDTSMPTNRKDGKKIATYYTVARSREEAEQFASGGKPFSPMTKTMQHKGAATMERDDLNRCGPDTWHVFPVRVTLEVGEPSRKSGKKRSG